MLANKAIISYHYNITKKKTNFNISDHYDLNLITLKKGGGVRNRLTHIVNSSFRQSLKSFQYQ
jgi:hypothetical protein